MNLPSSLHLERNYSLEMFYTPINEDFPVNKRLEIVNKALNCSLQTFKTQSEHAYSLKDKLIEIISEMWLEVATLSPNLQKLILISPVDITEEESSANEVEVLTKLALQLREKNIFLNEEVLNVWNSEIRLLGLERSDVFLIINYKLIFFILCFCVCLFLLILLFCLL